MNWEELTAPEFAAAVEDVEGVCLIPLGCIEKHGDHLPLGTDLMQIRAVAEAAAEQESVLVYPPYFYTQITCAKHQPGTIAIGDRLMLDLLEQTCVEIARNGLHKIILLNGHGGNEAFLQYFSWMMVYGRDHDFMPYLARLEDYWCGTHSSQYEKLQETTYDAHAGERETSTMMALRPELVKSEKLTSAGGEPLGRVKHLPLFTPIAWFADHPGHYAGDSTAGTPEKGQAQLDDSARRVAAIIKAVKNDVVASELMHEFRARSKAPRNTSQ